MRNNKYLVTVFFAFCLVCGLGALGGKIALKLALEHKASVLGMDWAHYIEGRFLEPSQHAEDATDAFDGIRPEKEKMVDALANVFAIGHIFQVDFFGLDCNCHVQVDAFDIVADGTEMDEGDHGGMPHSHSDHSPHIVMHAHDSATQRVLELHGDFPAEVEALSAMALKDTHAIKILRSDDPNLPATFASVYHTVSIGGPPAYILRVMVNLERQDA